MQSQFPRFGASDTPVFVPTSASLQLLQVPPLVDDTHELVVAVLNYFSEKKI